MSGTIGSIIVGVDGCPAGRLAVKKHLDTSEVGMAIYATFARPLDPTADETLIAIDVPIRLPDEGQPGGRQADIEARRLLSPRGSTVFSASGRNIFGAANYAEAREICARAGCPFPRSSRSPSCAKSRRWMR